MSQGINSAGFMFLSSGLFFDAVAISYPRYFDKTETAQYLFPLDSKKDQKIEGFHSLYI
jgi:hypothetical protein